MVGTVEDILVAKRRQNDELSEISRSVIARAIRVEIPVADLREHHLRELADLMRGVANSLEFIASRRDLPLHLKLYDVRNEVEKLKRWVGEKTGRYKWLNRQ